MNEALCLRTIRLGELLYSKGSWSLYTPFTAEYLMLKGRGGDKGNNRRVK